LTVTDIATRSTENRSVKYKAQKRVFAALGEIREAFPFPILGINADDTVNGPRFSRHGYGSDDRIEPTSRLTSSTGHWRADRVRGGPKIVCSGGETC